MYGVNIPAGWADKLNPGDPVIVQSRYRSSRSSSKDFTDGTVDKVTPTQVTVDGIAYRRGKGRSRYVDYRNEGYEIGALNGRYCGRIYPVTAATSRWLADLRREDDAAAEATRLVSEITAAAKVAQANGEIDRLRAAHRKLV